MIQVIIPADPIIMALLRTVNLRNDDYRPFSYVRRVEAGETVLFFHLLTRELAAVSADEESSSDTQEYLRKNCFFVPEKNDDHVLVNQVRDIIELRARKQFDPRSFTILTTTDCNARCYYCFEQGCKMIDMTFETAGFVADYIRKCCKGEKAHIKWFGGEPLFNAEAIDYLCMRLEENEQDFSSSMVSNGYLFNRNTVEKAVEKWKLKKVQITLDGTEDRYNRIKAFIYKDANPFRTVFDNIGLLLDAGIRVSVRLNVSKKNKDDLMALIKQIQETYGGKENLSVYSHELFSKQAGTSDGHGSDIQVLRDRVQIEDKLNETELRRPLRLNRNLKTFFCCADSGNTVVVLPDGNLTLCDDFERAGILGNVKEGVTNPALIDWWRERKKELPICLTCPLFPECISLEHCTSTERCNSEKRDYRVRNLDRSIIYEYQLWKESKAGDGEIPEPLC